jgi:carbamate kinase
VKIVCALGGNALLQRGEPLEPRRQQAAARAAANALAPLAREHTVIVTHGNGPQVGLLALQAGDGADAFGLDVLDAESEGMIGYALEQELANALPERDVVTVLTRVRVDCGDPAFTRPTKPIGRVYGPAEMQTLERERGWSFAPDGAGYRRVVPSPEPLDILPLPAIELLVAAGAIVVCAGGGGIPVVQHGNEMHGVHAVIDKDLASALLAASIGADMLLLLTDQPGVWNRFGAPHAELIRRVWSDELDPRSFPAGSMRPKVEAAVRFVQRVGGQASIGALADVVRLVRGDAGTQVCQR